MTPRVLSWNGVPLLISGLLSAGYAASMPPLAALVPQASRDGLQLLAGLLREEINSSAELAPKTTTQHGKRSVHTIGRTVDDGRFLEVDQKDRRLMRSMGVASGKRSTSVHLSGVSKRGFHEGDQHGHHHRASMMRVTISPSGDALPTVNTSVLERSPQSPQDPQEQPGALLSAYAEDASNVCLKKTGGGLSRQTCGTGKCAHFDDECHDGCYQQLNGTGGTYKIANARWSDQFMYMEKSFGNHYVQATDKNEGDKQEFFISVVPSSASEGLTFVLNSKKYRSHAVSFGLIADGEDTAWGVEGWTLSNARVEDAAVTLWKPPVEITNPIPETGTLVMIRGIKKDVLLGYLYAYIRNEITWFEKLIVSYHKDPGAGGYWYITPPLPKEVADKMLQYDGSTCLADCGKVEVEIEFPDGASSPSSLRGACIAIIVAFLLAAVPPPRF